jgi:flavin-dependent dehydrogenase
MHIPTDNQANSSNPNHFDAVIVGARAAGAATAMLLARRGLKVLAIDRDRYGSDTLSTHALMRGAVDHLERWGIAPELRAQVPAIHTTTFHYCQTAIDLDITGGGNSPLMAPRRTLLDRTMVDYAAEAGADVRHQTKLVDIARTMGGRVCGIKIEDSSGRTRQISCDLLIGADGRESTVARRLGVPITRQGQEGSPYVIRYVEDLELPGVADSTAAFQWLFGPNLGGGIIPTGDGQHAIFAGTTRERFRTEIRHDVTAGHQRLLDELHPEFAEAVRRSTPIERARSWPGLPGRFRKAFGPGWALVGDAGYFKDPYAAHGISDAFRDAELLADAVITGDFNDYEETRDRLSTPLFDVLEQVASYRWTLEELQGMHLQLGKAMSAEQQELAARREAATIGDDDGVIHGGMARSRFDVELKAA